MAFTPGNLTALDWDLTRNAAALSAPIDDFGEEVVWARLQVTAGVTYYLVGSTVSAAGRGTGVGVIDADGNPLAGSTGGELGILTFSATSTGSVFVGIANAMAYPGVADLFVTTDAASLVQASGSYTALAGERVAGRGDSNSIDLGVAGLDALGGGGDDSLTGNGLDNRLSGGTGDDRINAGDGNDAIWGGLGIDTIDGGAGNDIVYAGDAPDSVLGGDGIDQLRGGGGADWLEGGAGNDTIFGDAGNDYAIGGIGNDTVSGGDGDDRVAGAEGDDVLRGGAGEDGLVGDAGNDMIFGDDAHDFITGDDGNDSLEGGAANDQLYGQADNDVLRGGAGADTLDGGAGIDTASYYTGTVGVVVDLSTRKGSGGEAQGDSLYDIENLSGSQGNDSLIGTGGANLLQGWNGNDVLRGAAGADRLDGGAGIDTASYYSGTTGVVVSLVSGLGSSGEAQGDTLSGIENLSGSQGWDSLYGNAGANVLQGWNGNDALFGRTGKDTLTGGAGVDRFVYGSIADSVVGANADRITDFSHAQADRIDLAAIDARFTVAGDQAFSFIGTAAFTGVAGQLHYWHDAGRTIVSGDVNGNGTADFNITLTGTISLVAGDFVL
ncbi:calcium-binding protein [Inquilinus sp. CA228]|uniref:calcium-binding protein n=1 Tax=Inquilinus sp. CA228 TaxID=3455609 RepID=UPI003F8D6324